jgi:nickel transport protein
MKKNILTIACLLTFILCFPVTQALAHKVRIFAYAEGNTIVGETAFSGGRAPKDSEIIVQEASSDMTLLTTRTDEHGEFRFPIPEQARRNRLDLRIIINVGEGHRGEWKLTAEEYLDDAENSETGETVPVDTPEEISSAAPAEKNTPTVAVNEELIRKVVEDVMNRKLGPVKRMLAESREQGPTLQDILGGIGYLLGLAGIIAWFQSKIKKGE